MIADRRLYLAEDNVTVVEEGDPRAFSLLVGGPGQELPDAEAARLGITPRAMAPAPHDDHAELTDPPRAARRK